MSHPSPASGITDTDIPGTVYLVDIQHTETEIKHAGNKNILLVPQPLNTKRDPLVRSALPTHTRLLLTDILQNWPKYKKYWSLFLASLFACVMSFGENNLGAAWTTVAEESHTSLEQTNGGSAVNYLLLGFGNILWVPTVSLIYPDLRSDDIDGMLGYEVRSQVLLY